MYINVLELNRGLLKVTKVNIWLLTTHCAYGNIHLDTGARIQIFDSIGDDGKKLWRDLDITNFVLNDTMAIISFHEENKYDRFLIDNCEWDIDVTEDTYNHTKIKFEIRPYITYDGSKDLEHIEYTNDRLS